MILLNHAVAHPWLCDSMGHMTTRHYLGMFDDAGYVLMRHATGWLSGDPAWGGTGWADVRNEIDYVGEVLAGALVEIHGAVTGHGRSSIEIVMEMRKAAGGEVAAKLRGKSVFFDLVARKSRPLTAEMAVKIAAHSASMASGIAPRG